MVNIEKSISRLGLNSILVHDSCDTIVLYNLSPFFQQLLQWLDLDIHNSHDGIPVLALDMACVSLPPLGLLLDTQRLRFNTQHSHTALKHALIDIRRPLERKLARSNNRRPIKPQYIARFNLGHQKRKTEMVALGQEVRPVVQMRGYVVRSLAVQVWQFVGERFCDLEFGAEDGWHGEFGAWNAADEQFCRRRRACCFGY